MLPGFAELSTFRYPIGSEGQSQVTKRGQAHLSDGLFLETCFLANFSELRTCQVHRPHVIEASDGERYGVAVYFEGGVPVEVCYGDGELDMQHSEVWHEAPGILAPEEVARLFGDEEGER
jgi:hypothetical protein